MAQLGLTDAERLELDAKVNRLAEMGFTNRVAVTQVLLANGMNEEASLNTLLGSPTVSSGTVIPSPTPPPIPPKPNSGGAGLFGMKWGK